MADTATCKRTLEFTVPADEVEAEVTRVAADIQKKVKLPGFRPGKTPLSILRNRFAGEIRKDVVESLVKRHFDRRVEQDHIAVIGTPSVADLHFHTGEPMRFKVEFETAPEWELGEYRGLTVEYEDPSVSDADIDARIEALRDEHADYLNIDPRPAEMGDHAVVSLASIAGLEGEPITSDEMIFALGGQGSVAAFTDALIGVTPGEVKEVTASYPKAYNHERLAGKTVTFRVTLKGLRKKELPEPDDDFAKDCGDYQNLAELREDARLKIQREREAMAQQEAKAALIRTLVDAHDFPVPDALTDAQLKATLEAYLRELAAEGADLSNLKLDWAEVRKNRGEQAARDVKASFILDRIGEREGIETMADEMDREVHRLAKQLRQPAAAVRMKLEKDGTLGRLARQMRTDKVLNFLFEQARKVAPETPPQ